MSDINTSSKFSVKRRLKNHRLPETYKSDRFSNPYSPLQSGAGQLAPENPRTTAATVIEASPSKSKRNRYRDSFRDYDYEYYDDYVYYDYDLEPAYKKPKPKRRKFVSRGKICPVLPNLQLDKVFFHLGGSGGGINPLALLVAPLAAISLLAAAAAVAINPVLVQVSFTGKRRKRSVTNDENNDNDQEWNPEVQEKMHELQVSFTYVKKKKTFYCVCMHK